MGPDSLVVPTPREGGLLSGAVASSVPRLRFHFDAAWVVRQVINRLRLPSALAAMPIGDVVKR